MPSRVNPIWKATKAGYMDAASRLLADIQSSLVAHGANIDLIEAVGNLVEQCRAIRYQIVSIPNTE